MIGNDESDSFLAPQTAEVRFDLCRFAAVPHCLSLRGWHAQRSESPGDCHAWFARFCSEAILRLEDHRRRALAEVRVIALWDPKAGVYAVSSPDVPGFIAEAQERVDVLSAAERIVPALSGARPNKWVVEFIETSEGDAAP